MREPADRLHHHVARGTDLLGQLGQWRGTVLAERVDRFVIGGKEVVLPCNGAFEIKDGKIAVWRDYFDMATWQRQMQ